jgi:hypothetical protein
LNDALKSNITSYEKWIVMCLDRKVKL